MASRGRSNVLLVSLIEMTDVLEAAGQGRSAVKAPTAQGRGAIKSAHGGRKHEEDVCRGMARGNGEEAWQRSSEEVAMLRATDAKASRGTTSIRNSMGHVGHLRLVSCECGSASASLRIVDMFGLEG